MTNILFIVSLFVMCVCGVSASSATPPNYAAEAREMTASLQRIFWNPKRDIYMNDPGWSRPAYVWRQAAAFSTLIAAARSEPQTYRLVLAQIFKGMDCYWDSKAAIPAYEPAPTKGNGNDKYYDDNAWLLIAFLDAYKLTGDVA